VIVVLTVFCVTREVKQHYIASWRQHHLAFATCLCLTVKQLLPVRLEMMERLHRIVHMLSQDSAPLLHQRAIAQCLAEYDILLLYLFVCLLA